MDPQDPPNTIQVEIWRWVRIFSMSEMRETVSFWSRDACGVDLPAPGGIRVCCVFGYNVMHLSR